MLIKNQRVKEKEKTKTPLIKIIKQTSRRKLVEDSFGAILVIFHSTAQKWPNEIQPPYQKGRVKVGLVTTNDDQLS